MILRIILLLMPMGAVAAEAPVNTGNANIIVGAIVATGGTW